jgi:hypothetical protein
MTIMISVTVKPIRRAQTGRAVLVARWPLTADR